MRETAVDARPVCGDLQPDGLGRAGYSLENPAVQQKIRRVGIGRYARAIALQHVALRPLGNGDDREYLSASQRRPRIDQRRGSGDHFQSFAGVEVLNQLSAEFGVILIHYRDRKLAQQLAEIRLRIEGAVEDRKST